MGKIEYLLKLIDENLGLLDAKLGETTAEKLVNDPFALNSVLHILQVSAQALIDLASHVAAEAGLGIVEKYSFIPVLLAEKGVLDRDRAVLFRKIIGFRHVVVHGYAKISKKLVLKILEERKYRDILDIALRIAEWAMDKGLDP